jgi:hypothetical protein
MEFEIGEVVILKNYRNTQYNREGRVLGYDPDLDAYLVSNMDMPFMGTLYKYFSVDEIERKNVSE